MRSGRRSKLEIIGDVLRVIQKGSTRPTQILREANLTWPSLMVYLEALLRNQLITRETRRNRSTFRLTARGSDFLGMFLRLKEETDVLNLEMPSQHPLGELARPLSTFGGRKALSTFRSSLTAANFRVLENGAVGRSGTRYAFPLLVQGLSKSRYGFVVFTDVDESGVIRSFAKQLDTEVDLNIIYVRSISKVARRIAALDSIPVLSARNLAGFTERLAFLDAFRWRRSLLLEVDPSIDYERVIGALVSREARTCDVSVFTSKGSRTYPVIPRRDNVTLHIMQSASGEAQSRDRIEDPVSPPARHDIERLYDDSPQIEGKARLLVFDSVLELSGELGKAKARRWMKRSQTTGNVSGQRSLFILKRGIQEDTSLGLVSGLFRNRLTYDSSGLKLSRAM